VWLVTVKKVPRINCSYIDYFSNFDRDELSPTETIIGKCHHQICHERTDVKNDELGN